MAKNNNTERDRDATEQRMLKAVGEMIRRDGFEKLGVNAVAAHCGVSKILIYRYFGSLDGLLTAYIRQHDFWINFPLDIPGRAHLPEFLKKTFRTMIGRLHGDPTLRRLYRWELSSKNELVAALRRQREQAGLELIARVSRENRAARIGGGRAGYFPDGFGDLPCAVGGILPGLQRDSDRRGCRLGTDRPRDRPAD